MACHAVAAGIGIAILPRHTADTWIAGGHVIAIALDDPWASRNLALCFTAETDLSSTARALRDHLIAGNSSSVPA